MAEPVPAGRPRGARSAAIVLLAALAPAAAFQEPAVEFAALLEEARPGLDEQQLAGLAARLAAAPRAADLLLAWNAGGTSLLSSEQERILDGAALLLAREDVARAVSASLELPLGGAERLAAIDLLALHAMAPELPLLIRLVAEGRDETPQERQSLDSFSNAVAALLRRDPEGFARLSALGYVPGPGAVALARGVGRAGLPEGFEWLADQLGQPDLTDVALQEICRLAGGLPGARAENVAAAVRPFLESEESGRRRSAMRALAALGDERSLPLLIGTLARAEGGERSEAATALRRISGRSLPDRLDAWRSWYLAELRWWREESGPVFERLTSDDPAAVASAIRAISGRSLRREDLARELARLVGEHPSPAIRDQACRGLALLGSQVAVPALVAALEDLDGDVRTRAHSALLELTGMNLEADPSRWREALQATRRGVPAPLPDPGPAQRQATSASTGQ